MTRKDYVTLAAAMKAAKDEGIDLIAYMKVVRSVARTLQENPRFDTNVFIDNCGLAEVVANA